MYKEEIYKNYCYSININEVINRKCAVRTYNTFFENILRITLIVYGKMCYLSIQKQCFRKDQSCNSCNTYYALMNALNPFRKLFIEFSSCHKCKSETYFRNG